MASTFSHSLRSLDADNPRGRGIAIVAGALATSWIAWFLAAPVPVYEVAEDARLEVKAAAHPVAAQVDGRVLETGLALGREVRAGEVLVILDAEAERLTLGERRTRRDSLAATLRALRAEIGAEQEAMSQHQRARVVAVDELRAQVEESEARAKFAELQLANLAKLGARGAVSREDLLRGQAEAKALRAAVRTDRLAMERLERDREVQEGDRRVRLAALGREAVELEGEIATDEVAIQRLQHAIELRNVRAPIAGRVGEAAPEFRVGSVVRVGERLGTIVPPGEPRAVALFPVASVGRIGPGQPARLRLHGFPWTHYGTVPARVADIGNEASGGRVRVELGLEPDPRSSIPLAHGLPGSAEVEVERVTPAVLALRGAGRYLAARRGVVSTPGRRAGP